MGACNLVIVVFSLIVPLILFTATADAEATEFHDRKLVYVRGLQTRHVQVYNNLTNGDSFGIHCKSKDNNLGFHIMGPNQVYQFKFKANVWGSTRFYCGVSLKGDRGVVFDLFKDSRDGTRCPTFCRWSVFRDGVHGYREDTGAEDQFFAFN
ncbi:hypothetical protein MLD38_028222 [Melastoma candidum]|uniref:Uncharacterized protein n=1 Tax=Melastoma candidum TaxID=119954 RepID=A0ACB9N2L0_9MYRT|nr:hypothetical protein MLD38_028222 [Melastoma candidum]